MAGVQQRKAYHACGKMKDARTFSLETKFKKQYITY